MTNATLLRRGKRVAKASAFFLVALALVGPVSAFAIIIEAPRSFSLTDESLEKIERKILPAIDIERQLAEDRARDKNPQLRGPYRFAVAADVSFTLENSGTWLPLHDGRVWRLRIQSPGAKNMNLGITRYDMPEGAKLWIYNPGRKQVEGAYTSRDRTPQGALWTTLIHGNEIVVEVFVPTDVSQPVLDIRKVNQGYRAIDMDGAGNGLTTCPDTIDVVCPEGNAWADQRRSVGQYTLNGTDFCTGTMLNNTQVDFVPYFLTAFHCGVTSANAGSVVVYWKHEWLVCRRLVSPLPPPPTRGLPHPGGAIHLSGDSTSDFVLLQLAQMPAPGAVYYAGWDASGVAPTAAVGIHHPRGDGKAIALFTSSPTNQVITAPYPPTDTVGKHWHFAWESNMGVTEPGSSGSCLFDANPGPVAGPGKGRCIGQLHGGQDWCPVPGTNQGVFYGKLSESWSQLQPKLAPGSTGSTVSMHGEPHIKTANGIHYDFQAAGEFVALRSDGLEIQTRKAPIATTVNPGPDPNGLATCVSINSAIAMRVGKHRVTYQPNLSGVPDPSGLQLRVDGVLAVLGAKGIELGDGSRIVKTTAPGGIEIKFPDRSAVFVTPGWWNSQGKWYFNVDVFLPPRMNGAELGKPHIPATLGIAGAVVPGSWLPALDSVGSSVGPRPESLQERYAILYQKFANAWRVNDQTSLFDYAPGTSTATYTMLDWPRESGQCVFPNATPAAPASELVAQQACEMVKDANARKNCVFDVRVTGHTGFATTYVQTEQVLAEATGSTTTTPSTRKLAAFLGAGAGFPNGIFSNGHRTGFSFNAGLERMFNSSFAAVGILGYHHFPRRIGGSVDIYQLSGNAKVYLVSAPNNVRPFLNGGIGVYALRPGNTKFGANIGGGVLFDITPRLGLQGSYNFHTINTLGSATRFSSIQLGVRFVF